MVGLARSSAKGKSNIGICVANFGLTSTASSDALGPADLRAVKGGLDTNGVAREWVTEDVRKIVPDLLAIQGIGEVRLRASVVKTILNSCELDGNASRRRVMVQNLRIGGAGFNRLRRTNGPPDRPKIDREAAFVDNFSVPNGAGKRSQGGDGSNNSSGKVHFECWRCP